MEVTFELLLALFFVAGAAGFIDAMAGGGGLLTLPALLASGMSPTQALATNKLQSSFGSFSASWYFVRSGIVSLKEMRLAIVCTFVGSAIGAEAVQYVDASVLTSLIPLLLIAISLYFLLAPTTKADQGESKLSEAAFALSVGGGVGFYDGFFGPGTGSFFAISLVFLLGFNLVKATAQTKILNLSSNLAALLYFIYDGYILWDVGLLMFIGQVIGGKIGAQLVLSKGKPLIKFAMIAVSIGVSTKMLFMN